MKPKKAIAALSALSHESRLEIFRLLMQKGEGGMAAGALAEALNIPPATLSFHLSQLSGAGLVQSIKSGRMVIYTASYKRLKKLIKFLTADHKETQAAAGLLAQPSAVDDVHEEVHEIDIL